MAQPIVGCAFLHQAWISDGISTKVIGCLPNQLIIRTFPVDMAHPLTDQHNSLRLSSLVILSYEEDTDKAK